MIIILKISINIYIFLTHFLSFFCFTIFGDIMKVKIFDLEDEKDLENEINNFLDDDMEVIDIKYSVSSSIYSEEQIFCFSAMIIYY